jgi:hypothetical protein
MMIRRVLGVAVGALALAALVGCTPPVPEPTLAPSPSASTASATPTPTPDPVPVFTTPTNCAELIGPDLAAEFAADSIVLFDSTNGEGIYANGFTLIQDGGDPFACLFGQDMVDLSSFQLEVQPVSSQGEHEGIVAVLGSQGFVQTTDGDVVTFTQVGNEMDTEPTIIHVLRLDSWMTAYAHFGGQRQADRLAGYLAQVAAHLYTTP